MSFEERAELEWYRRFFLRITPASDKPVPGEPLFERRFYVEEQP